MLSPACKSRLSPWMAAEARARGLVPTGWFHVIELLFNTPAGEHDPVSDVLQLGCIVE